MIKASIGIILNEERSKVYLSLRQAHQTYSGFWEFPGGKVEENESYEECIKREIFEEVGIIAQELELLEKKDYINKYNIHIFLEFYLITKYEGLPKAKEGQKLKLVNIYDLNKYNILPASESVIEKLIKLNKQI
ncbi:8-oxo-dGTP diphosphatase MutT [Francisella frigiditurris]|uniref:8-oxo-dGTP diphosphatase n=1 Tax=Francisella frigiditurris TaxID=1542390 RepID=A0A1J0KUB1_9GAMM|nr:8-oxo-dGTP diphosphatase MutT [Francisella frigiditurris]APC97357.1 mutator mutT family protein [Francisella frigiditurris]